MEGRKLKKKILKIFKFPRLVLTPDSPSDGGDDNWADLADTLLCAGNTALEIRDGLRAVWPNYHWFVLVQDADLIWFSNKDLDTELHHADDLCGKNMVVWMYSGILKRTSSK